jgi:hypothetical protein
MSLRKYSEFSSSPEFSAERSDSTRRDCQVQLQGPIWSRQLWVQSFGACWPEDHLLIHVPFLWPKFGGLVRVKRSNRTIDSEAQVDTAIELPYS